MRNSVSYRSEHIKLSLCSLNNDTYNYVKKIIRKLKNFVRIFYLSATDTGSIALEPRKVATGVWIKKVGLRWLTYAERNIVIPAEEKMISESCNRVKQN